MSRNVTSCHVMSHNVTSCHVMPRNFTSRHVTSRLVMEAAWTRGSGKLSSTWSRVNAQMMTSLPSPFTLSSLPFIDRVCAAKACPGRDTNSLRVLTRVLISLPLVKVFSFLFLIFWFHCIVTFYCMLSCICMLT